MKLYTRQEAAEYLRIGLRTLDRRIAEGEIECYRLGEGTRAPVRLSDEHLNSYLCRDSAESITERASEILERRGGVAG